jgi:ADP-ribose pyrophosphatase
MHAIVITDGLSLEDFDADRRYQHIPSKIGKSEIARLMGSGRQFGHGPFVRFLNSVAALAEKDRNAITWLMIYDEEAQDDDNENNVIERIKTLYEQEFAEHVNYINTSPGKVPWQSIIDIIKHTPDGLPSIAGGAQDTHVLLVGFPTDGRILALGQLLHNMLGYREVAVCPHLVGSLNPEAHTAALQHGFPAMGIKVLLDLADAARFIGMNDDELDGLTMPACHIEPPDVLAQLPPEQADIIQRICMQWSSVELQALQGGFSGSLLMLASGLKGEAHTEPMVIKVDHAAQMQRELDGYHQIFDYLSRQVPKFGYPIAKGPWIGVGMALAALDGRPWTLQDYFEDPAPTPSSGDTGGAKQGIQRFFFLLEKALSLLSSKLYQNTHNLAWLAPYRELRLHTEETLHWYDENIQTIQSYAEEAHISLVPLDFARTRDLIAQITANEDLIETDVCLVHGDLNFKNIIFDDANNIWFIDWTHTGMHPIEVDFAKLENDLKFVMSKHFDQDDLVRLRLFEEFLVSQRIPPAPEALEGPLQFVKWDLRYRNILEAVILIRRACFALKHSERWLCYRITLLKLGLHTLSFDQRRDQGECGLIQLLHAAISVHSVTIALLNDDYQTRISAARPSSYPRRQRIAIEQVSWSKPCPDYDPPYYVDDVVLENNHLHNSYGWADPETLDPSWWQIPTFDTADLDAQGRPLNPAGRTGIAGRGLLGRWGVNPAVGAVIVRVDGGPVEILVGRRGGPESLGLARRFLQPGESPVDGTWRMIQELTTYRAPLDQALERFSEFYDAAILFEGPINDPRQTDHAWVTLSAHLIQLSTGIVYGSFGPTQALGQVEWRSLDAETINEFDPISARLVRLAIGELCRNGAIGQKHAQSLFIQTGRSMPC